VNVFERFGTDAFAFGLEIRDLAANHALDGARGGRDFGEHLDAEIGRDRSGGDGFEGQSEQGVAGQDGDGFAKFFVAGRFAAAEVIVIECGEIVVNERVGVDEFYSAAGMKRRGDVGGEDAGGFKAEDGPDAFAAGKDRVAHGLVDGGGRGFGRGEEALQGGVHELQVLIEEGREGHFVK